jgi:acetyltransferase-like isoleucine patch superfamily enzyme
LLSLESIGENSAQLMIGEMSHIGERTELHCGNKITIGKHVRIGWDCIIMDRDYHSLPGFPEEETLPVNIRDNVWIGCRVIILKGVTIGEGAIVGAGSVVTKDVDPNTVVVGNPAQLKRRTDPLSVSRGLT